MRTINLLLIGTVVVAGTTVAASDAAQTYPSGYDGLCEASAAASLVDGQPYFAVANDETGVIRIYERGDRRPLQSFTHSGVVTDIEAATRIGKRIYWLTSHSRTAAKPARLGKPAKPAQDKDERRLLFVTTVTAGANGGPPTLADGGEAKDLRPQIAEALHVKEADLKVSLEIEGLGATPEGSLLLGLRAPLIDGKAIVIEVTNPDALGSDRKQAGFSRVALLNLDGMGIRSLEQSGTGAHAYLISAAPVGDKGTGTPALFWWDGHNAVIKVHEIAMPGAVPRAIPEAMIVWSETDVQFLGDNGERDSSGGGTVGCDDKGDGPYEFPSLNIDPTRP